MNIMHYVSQCIEQLKKAFPDSINAIETGTIRSYHEKHESTKHIAQALGNHGVLTSVDINPNSLIISKDICKGLNNIRYVESDSHKFLKSLNGEVFHFALLDSVNDKDFIFEEFKLVLPLMHENGIIVVDDAGITPSGVEIDKTVEAQKGHSVWRLLYENKIEFAIVQTPHGHGTQIIVELNKTKVEMLKKLLGLSEKKDITFTANILALNEEFWIEKQLKHIYDFFDEIIICEGTEQKNNASDHGFPNDLISEDGFSTDNTREIIKNFPDPDDKIRFIPYGRCKDKVELCRATYHHSNCDYVWEVDCDEFYMHDTMQEIKDFLSLHTNINQINFRMRHFIDFENCIHGEGGKTWGDDIPIRRIFRNEDGNNFVNHRPPTIKYKTDGRVVEREESFEYGWIMYHYPYVFDWQVDKKANYYPDGQELKKLKAAWQEDHTKPLLRGSTTTSFSGKHPKIIEDYLNEL